MEEELVRLELVRLVSEYQVTSAACPSQIEGNLSTGEVFYIRYRNCSYYAEVNGYELVRLRMVIRDYEDEDYMSVSKMLNLFYLAYSNRGEEE